MNTTASGKSRGRLYDLIVIGGGSAGLVVAGGAAQLGARVALIEKKALGGDCLYTGCVPSKTLIRSARFAAEVRRAEDFGFATWALEFKDREFASITDRVARVIETVGEHDRPERFAAWGVEVIFAAPRFLSPRELEIIERDGTKRIITAKRFCISTGSRPAIPPVEGLKEAGFLTNTSIFQIRDLPQSLIVLGGGPVGLELGQSFARFGSEVTIVEMDDRLLPKEDEEISATIEQIMRAEGLKILLNYKAVRARLNNGRKILTVEQNGLNRELPANEILVASGRKPNVEGLNLEVAGVKYDEKHILTDDYLRTSTRHIFAAGDATGHFPFTHMAAYEASVVIRNALFFRPLLQKTDFRVVPWATFTDPEVARVGFTESGARKKFGAANVRIYRTEFVDNDRAQAEESTKGFAKIVCRGRKNEIVGAHIIGPQAGELIHEVILAMKQRLSINALGSMIHVYPTLTQVNQQAGLDAVLGKLGSYQKLLSYYFRVWR
jgi:pyruvate/2-oxoglutarate dehydrogenase complex dihydrolipoamide dehydrogenase (E3) component